MKSGLHQSRLGFDPNKMDDADNLTILQKEWAKFENEIDQYKTQLITEELKGQWHIQHWTARESFRFGLMTMFKAYPELETKKGAKILTEETIDKLTQEQFRGCKNFAAFMAEGLG